MNFGKIYDQIKKTQFKLEKVFKENGLPNVITVPKVVYQKYLFERFNKARIKSRNIRRLHK